MTPIRIYCFMMGQVAHRLSDGGCPECGQYGLSHRVVEGLDCGNFVSCGSYAVIRDAHGGHPCERAEGHDGPCAAPGAEEDCRVVADSGHRLRDVAVSP